MSDGDVIAIGEPGRAALEIGRGAPTYHPDTADHELSECAVPGAQVRAASIRGIMHRYKREPRQDRFSLVYDDATATLLVVVCDGVGQFALSQEAAAFVAADIPGAYLRHGAWEPAVAEVNARLFDVRAAAADRSRLHPPADTRMATTLAAAAIRWVDSRPVASIAWTDDTSIWALSKHGWEQLTGDHAPDDGDAVASTRVRALPHEEPRLAVREVDLTGAALFVTTDGVGKPLEYAAQVQDTLAEWWETPPDIFTFARQVGFARKAHIDDRTAVGVWFE